MYLHLGFYRGREVQKVHHKTGIPRILFPGIIWKLSGVPRNVPPEVSLQYRNMYTKLLYTHMQYVTAKVSWCWSV